MTGVTRIVINSLQIPAAGKTVAELRAKAVQQLGMEPVVEDTPEATESGEETVIPQPNPGA